MYTDTNNLETHVYCSIINTTILLIILTSIYVSCSWRVHHVDFLR